MAVSRNYSSVAQPTTLTGNISGGDVTVGVVSPTGFPTPPFTAALDYGSAAEELVEVTAASLGTWTVTRGIDGTSSQSHSIGAVVRHVTSARDSADSRAHEAATSGVHGISGALVGTADTQTLANKTFTAPNINAGALSGTFTGSPVFSGGPAFSGNPVFSGAPSLNNGGALGGTFSGTPTYTGTPTYSGVPILVTRTLSTDATLRTRLTTDTFDRLTVNAAGGLTLGPGNSAGDTNLYRGSAGVLKTDSALTVAPTGANGGATVNVTGGAFTGKMLDVQLAGVSKFSVDQGGNVAAGNMTMGAWASWTPTWTTSTGSHQPSYGNSSVVGSYAKFGRTLLYTLSITFGSSVNFGAGATTSDNWVFSMPGGFTAPMANSDNSMIVGSGRALLTASATIPIVVRAVNNGTGLSFDTSGGRQDGAALTNTAVLDSLTPWTWTSGGILSVFGVMETTV